MNIHEYRIEVIDFDTDVNKADKQPITRMCRACGGKTTIWASNVNVIRWSDGGAYIQDVWPDVTPGSRETLMTGYHSACFDGMFKEDEDE